ncbi:hypothetical protein NL108_018222 [Boleophthalmus pectinirostris]|nr:hypothetical protein NL108_018222 [Boleophthalmus pectinirostris]
MLDSSPLLQGEKYCVQAQSELPSGSRSSPRASQCVDIPGPGGSWSWKRWVIVVFAVLLSVGFFSTVIWLTVHGPPQVCLRFFHREALPHSLEDWDISLPETEKKEEPQEEVHMLKVVQEAPPPSTVALHWGRPPPSAVELL